MRNTLSRYATNNLYPTGYRRFSDVPNFLLKATTNPTLANEAMVHITDSLALLNNAPKLGRYYDERRQLREYIIRFGRNAYLALYDYNEDKALVSILRIKHSRQANYHNWRN